MNILIARLGDSSPIRFAAQELYAYLTKMDPEADVAVLSAKAYDPERKNTLWLGIDPAFDALLPKVADRKLDDAIYVNICNGCGIVTGTNDRSVLIAAYRLLRENGCAFLKPGKDGEIVPAITIQNLQAQVCEAASSRHRGVCIEGAISYGHIINMIAFLPKIGMNAYFIQFFAPLTFFDRWYTHAYNPLYPTGTLSREEIMEIKESVVEEITRRGLLYHAVGHGWTCEPFGIEGDTWDEREYQVSDDARSMLAEVNGKRELWYGVPLNTNLCYGNQAARDRVTDAIADYCDRHREVDYLHFWLADGSNNHCECPLCRDTVPADFYVTMLNELDAKMTAREIPTKVVFLIYVDLLWEPQRVKLVHPERFVLMFAPITRTYTTPFLPDAVFDGELTPYRRNQNVMPRNVAENVARLKKWQQQFSGDGFDFDYHFMWDHLKDPGYYEMARILMEDMKNLHKIGLNGMLSCQNQRVFFPNALGMHAMAEALWNREAEFEPLAKAYFARQYGADGEAARAYLQEVSQKIDPPYLRFEKPAVDQTQAAQYRSIESMVEAFIPTIEENLRRDQNACVRRAWYELELHAGLLLHMGKMLALRAEGDAEGAKQAWRETADYARALEPEVGEDFDVFEYLQTLGGVMEH